MATTGTIPSNYFGIWIGTDLIACSTSCTVDMGTAMISSSCKDTGNFESSLPGQKNWSVSLEGNLAFDSSYGYIDLQTAWDSQTELTVKWSTNITVSGTPEVGDTFHEGSAYIESLSTSAPLNDVTTYSVSFKGTGVLTTGTNV